MATPPKQSEVLERVHLKGGLGKEVSSLVAKETGTPEAEIHGAASFFHLLKDPDTKLRVCTGLSCTMQGSRELLKCARDANLPVDEASCLAACDRAPAVLKEREVLVEIAKDDIVRCKNDWQQFTSKIEPSLDWRGVVGPIDDKDHERALCLDKTPSFDHSAFKLSIDKGPDWTIETLKESGLQGRGGAGFPSAIKWRGVKDQPGPTKYIVLNADEGEPGTFKDRDVMLQRPDLVLEGLAIAAVTLDATDVYLYLRGEFQGPWRALKNAILTYHDKNAFPNINFHLHAGHGAYICGEETALLEALEGKRGMPRLKPPFPHENGLWGKPTLIQNVETIACIPAILHKGGEWFKNLGRGEAGSKLYSISGDVKHPGTYELPLGVTLDELVECAGGYIGTLKMFSPGGASSGFLPANKRSLPLAFKTLADAGSMLGSAGVVVLNDTRSVIDATMDQLIFFENESCGQCAPCRIGCRVQRESLKRFNEDTGKNASRHLKLVDDVAWEMIEGSICGLGQTAPLPLTSAQKYFPEDFSK